MWSNSMDNRAIGADGYGGQPVVGSNKALNMIRFPRPSRPSKIKRLGHPIWLGGKNSGRKRGKSAPQGRARV